MGRAGADGNDWGLLPVRAADGAEIEFAGGLTLLGEILDGGAGTVGGRMTRRIWESAVPGGGIMTCCVPIRTLD